MIAISAGHYPEAPGACFGKYCEHPEAVRWVAMLMELMGHEATRVPTGHLGSKVEFINQLPAVDVAIEVHFNAAAGVTGTGSLCLYDPGSTKGKELATILQSRLEPIFGKHWNGVMEGWYHMDRPGIKDYPGDIEGDEHHDYFLHKTKCPAVILEPEFIHNFLKIETHREAACVAIADGLKEYLSKL